MRWKINFVLLVFFFLSLSIFLASKFSVFPFLTGGIQQIFATPKAAIYSAKTQINSGNPQVKKLQEENLQLTQKFADYENLKKDNNALRSQFQVDTVKSDQLLPARVIGFLGSVDSPDTLIIDRGNHDGIKKGMVVIFQNNLVGMVDTVSEEYSHVIVPQNINFTLLAKTLQDGTPGIISGAEDFMVFSHVVITDKLSMGDLVESRGDINNSDINVYPNIIVGKIYSIDKGETKPFQTAQIKPLINYSRLTIVFVVMGVK